MILHDAAVTIDGRKLLCVGTLATSVDGLRPMKAHAEKQIVGQSLPHISCESQGS